MPAAPCFYLFGIVIRFRSNSLFRPYFSPYKHRPAEPTQNAFVDRLQAPVIFHELQQITGGSKYLFPSVRSWHRPISDNTLNAALRRLGYDKTDLTVHGLRSTASVLLNASGKWHADAIERQLAHQEANEIRGAYTHAAEFWQERVRMMCWWTDERDRLREHGRVVRIRA